MIGALIKVNKQKLKMKNNISEQTHKSTHKPTIEEAYQLVINEICASKWSVILWSILMIMILMHVVSLLI